MQEDVRLQRAHEKERGSARIADANDARFGCAAEVVGDDAQSEFRRRVLARCVERQHERCRRAVVHVNGEVRRDRLLRERDEALGDRAEDDARIGCGVQASKFADETRHLYRAALQRGDEELVFGAEVAQDGGGGDAELGGDIGERGRFVAFGDKDAACCFQQLFTGDARRTSHC
jgi:hypothetical protein